ncbi:allophanate hydrolase [Salipiger pallidus]|uniref:Allophanate hydrolase n=1 Tax=Salipiger pallidus TaxID=1775170 RepID=A0A8J3EIQ0_9RHOB|nr:biotin-dependent carboxyltransferase family protein [Salipiger pallidus]GGG82586.1 allophanate hydrolase [Salipiger pallidus]
MSLDVLQAGPMTSIQDHGRHAHKRFGVPAAGAMDRPALDLANALCGNAPEAAALEFTGLGGTFRAGADMLCAVTGGECQITVEGKTVPSYESFRVSAGDTLRIGALRGAVWGYMAVAGGIDVPQVLGARATHLRFALGGIDGRPLAAGDTLPVGEAEPGIGLRPREVPAPASAELPIRIVAGPQDDYFDADTLALLTSAVFTVSPQRDRMAMALDGQELRAAQGHDIVSDGIVPGAIQVPASGRPMVLMADAQTTGGYPKIATVASVDLPRLAQLPTGATFRFELVSRDRAEDLAIAERARLREVLAGLIPAGRAALSSEFLLSCNLAGGVADPAAVMGDLE